MRLGTRLLACGVALAVLLPLTLQPAAAEAQGMRRIAFALDVTDRAIDAAAEPIARAENPEAAAELTAARDAQARARGAFEAGRPRIAIALTMEARAHTERALALGRGAPEPDRTRNQVGRTREMLERARRRIEPCNEPKAHDLLEEGARMQQQAEEALAAGRSLAAVELTLGARDRGFRALRACHLEDELPATVDQALGRTDQVLDLARGATGSSPDPRARRALEEARDQQSQAQQAYRSGQFESSLRKTQTARAMAHRAMRLGRGR